LAHLERGETESARRAMEKALSLGKPFKEAEKARQILADI
jgi:hypothetical protein